MDYAVSMYGGGSVIMAIEANYETAKELGCKCPLCSEAVFLRAGAIRTNRLRNGKQKKQVVNPSFCHYKGSEMSDCDNRVYTKEGWNKLEQFKLNSHNQRLSLYNRHLWEMFMREHDVKKDRLQYMKKLLGNLQIDLLAIEARQLFANLGSDSYPFVYDAFCKIASVKPEQLKHLKKEFKDNVVKVALTEREILYQQKLVEYEYKQRLHLAICYEIVEFLGTRTSGYFWRKIVPQIIMAAIERDRKMGRSILLKRDWVRKYAEFFFLKETNMLQNYVIALIVSTCWTTQINRELKC